MSSLQETVKLQGACGKQTGALCLAGIVPGLSPVGGTGRTGERHEQDWVWGTGRTGVGEEHWESTMGSRHWVCSTKAGGSN